MVKMKKLENAFNTNADLQPGFYLQAARAYILIIKKFRQLAEFFLLIQRIF